MPYRYLTKDIRIIGALELKNQLKSKDSLNECARAKRKKYSNTQSVCPSEFPLLPNLLCMKAI